MFAVVFASGRAVFREYEVPEVESLVSASLKTSFRIDEPASRRSETLAGQLGPCVI